MFNVDEVIRRGERCVCIDVDFERNERNGMRLIRSMMAYDDDDYVEGGDGGELERD